VKVLCNKCCKEYDVSDEQIQETGGQVVFSCEACNGTVEIDLTKKKKLTGDLLRDRILREVEDLPPMPQVAQKGRKIIADKTSSFKDLATVIENDQAIAARVLKIANSSYYGVSSNVKSVQQASVVLGMETLRELLTLACASSLMGSELRGYELSTGDLWQHSLATAFCARSIALKLAPQFADDAFSAGLIHDSGKLILDSYVNERKEEFRELLESGDKTFLEAEKSILGFDHSEIAADICNKWQIPETITTVIRYHHNPSRTNNNVLAFIVHIADAVALMCGLGAGLDGALYSLDDVAVKELDLKIGDISLLMTESVEYVEKTTGSF
jgi:putative nucleotidyltransferase with HDIG domain